MQHPKMPITKPFLGVACLLLSMLALTGLDATGKWVMATGVPLLFFCWIRYIVHSVLVLAIATPSLRLSVFKTKQPKLQLIRAVAMLCATLTFFTTLSHLHQAEATALIFIAPLLMLLVAPWLLKERSYPSRWIAAAFGLLGIIIVARPSAGLPWVGVLYGLITACLFTGQHLVSRMLAADNALTTSLLSGTFGAAVLSLTMPFVLPEAWSMISTLSWKMWALILLGGICGGMGQLLQIQSYRFAPASMLAPFIYLQIIFAATFGWLIWSHMPDGLTWVGIGIICASGVINSLVEWRRSQRG
jgi:drug/metabolite transporter (DMT)-like permease